MRTIVVLVASLVFGCGGSSSTTPDGRPGDAPVTPGDVAATTCGNAVVDPGEQCDDNNTASNDGCSETCRAEIGEPATTSPAAPAAP